jgi:hypothetical protein
MADPTTQNITQFTPAAGKAIANTLHRVRNMPVSAAGSGSHQNTAFPNYYLFPVTLIQDGGSDGSWNPILSQFSFPSYTYTVHHAVTNEQLGTGISPQMRWFQGSCGVGVNGFGAFIGGPDTFALWITDEAPNLNGCQNYDGVTP